MIVLLCFALVLVWPSIHSYRGWHMLKPFGLNEVNTIYAISGAKTVEFHVNSPQGVFYYIFSSAALYTPGHLQPLSDWQSPRSRMFHFIINPEEGRRDWDRALNIAHENPYPYIQQVTDNMLTFLFAGPWPDSSYDKKADKVLYINGLLRWGWAPLILGMALLFVPFLLARPRQEQLVVVLVTGAMIGAMFLQFTGVMEGRFRKPLEPLMITAFAVMLQMILARRRKY
ncbi:MAG: hypothetical protein KDD76_02915 [Rickettsiales bacterium]|nr:hypothetical protein [Rickettsiales bacterium]